MPIALFFLNEFSAAYDLPARSITPFLVFAQMRKLYGTVNEINNFYKFTQNCVKNSFVKVICSLLHYWGAMHPTVLFSKCLRYIRRVKKAGLKVVTNEKGEAVGEVLTIIC